MVSGAHPHDHGPSHTSAPNRSSDRQRRLAIALGLNLVIVVAQVVAGFVAHSLGLLSDAGHNLTDVVAVGASLAAVGLSRRAPTAQRSYGYHRATILAALLNAAAILVVTVFIVVEAVRRIVTPRAVDGGIVVAVALIATVVNAIAALVVHEGHGDGPSDLNMRSALLHLVGDAGASAAVAAAGLVILITGRYFWLDPAASIVLAALIAFGAYRLLREAIDVLLESTPNDIDLDALRTGIVGVEGVEGVHDLHVWSLSSDMRALSAHLLVDGHPSLEDAHEVGERAKVVLARDFGITHTTLEFECESCFDPGYDPCAMEPAEPPAMRR